MCGRHLLEDANRPEAIGSVPYVVKDAREGGCEVCEILPPQHLVRVSKLHTRTRKHTTHAPTNTLHVFMYIMGETVVVKSVSDTPRPTISCEPLRCVCVCCADDTGIGEGVGDRGGQTRQGRE